MPFVCQYSTKSRLHGCGHAESYPLNRADATPVDPLDVVGYNYKEQLYEKHHTLYPDKPFLGSENGHSRSPTQ